MGKTFNSHHFVKKNFYKKNVLLNLLLLHFKSVFGATFNWIFLKKSQGALMVQLASLLPAIFQTSNRPEPTLLSILHPI